MEIGYRLAHTSVSVVGGLKTMTIHGNYKRKLTRTQTKKLHNLLEEIENGHMLTAKTALAAFIENEGFTSRGK